MRAVRVMNDNSRRYATDLADIVFDRVSERLLGRTLASQDLARIKAMLQQLVDDSAAILYKYSDDVVDGLALVLLQATKSRYVPGQKLHSRDIGYILGYSHALINGNHWPSAAKLPVWLQGQ